MKLSVIIPVYNEAETVADIVEAVQSCGVEEYQIIVVNDCSNDRTREKLAVFADAPDVTIVHHEVNRGKGAAVRTAQKLVEGDAVVIQDADFEYDPRELPKLLQPIAEDKADAVYGSRYSGREILVDSFWHYVGNKALTTCSNLLSNLHLTDMETCYKMMRADIFKEMELECDRFGIEPEIAAKLAKLKCRVYEAPISYSARRFDQGKKIGWKDGVAALWHIVKYNLLK